MNRKRDRPPLDPKLVNRLETVSSDLRELESRIAPVQAERNDLVLEALASGWTHKEISDVTGLTRGRIGQIKPKQQISV